MWSNKRLYTVLGIICAIAVLLLLYAKLRSVQEKERQVGVYTKYEWFVEQEHKIRDCLAKELDALKDYRQYYESLPNKESQWDEEMLLKESELRSTYVLRQHDTDMAIEDYNAKSAFENADVFGKLPTYVTRNEENINKLIYGGN